jgi:putative transposase
MRVSPNRPRRIRGFTYTGKFRYFVTCVVQLRRPVFRNEAAGREVIAQLLQSAMTFQFAVLAYCVMPDHVHALVEGTSDSSDFRAFMHSWKQQTAFQWKQRHGSRLWREGYHERVLRSDESAQAVASYVLQNPVRAGLVTVSSEYSLSGPHAAGPAGLQTRRRVHTPRQNG